MKNKITIDDFYMQMYNQRWQEIKSSFFIEKEYANVSLTKEYFVDIASHFIASKLPIENNDNILDACACPGGKSLVLLSKINDTNILTLNEYSKDRFFRLMSNIKEHSNISENVKFLNFDAKNLYKFENKYDKIFLDVPCSSDSHVIKDQKYLKQWTPNRTKSLAIQAHTLLQSALISLKSGGMLMYSTCTISKFENEDVISKTLKKGKVKFELVKIDTDCNFVIENAEFGYYIMPDKNKGSGPLYFCLVRKL